MMMMMMMMMISQSSLVTYAAAAAAQLSLLTGVAAAGKCVFQPLTDRRDSYRPTHFSVLCYEGRNWYTGVGFLVQRQKSGVLTILAPYNDRLLFALTVYGHIKTAKQRTIHQYGDWYTGR